MSPEGGILANMHNAARSTGPKTVAGKARSSRNAVKHGLNVSIRHEPGASDNIEALTVAVAGDNPTPQRLRAARDIAEAHLELGRIQQLKLALMESEATRLRAGVTEDRSYQNDRAELATSEYTLACMQALPALTKLDRYERRALSRHRRAIHTYLIAAGE